MYGKVELNKKINEHERVKPHTTEAALLIKYISNSVRLVPSLYGINISL